MVANDWVEFQEIELVRFIEIELKLAPRSELKPPQNHALSRLARTSSAGRPRNVISQLVIATGKTSPLLV